MPTGGARLSGHTYIITHGIISGFGVTNELNEDSEHWILEVGSKTLQRTNDLFSEGLYFNEQIDKLIKTFDKTLSNESMSDYDMSYLVA